MSNANRYALDDDPLTENALIFIRIMLIYKEILLLNVYIAIFTILSLLTRVYCKAMEKKL